AGGLLEFGEFLLQHGNPGEAETLVREGVQLRRQSYGNNHWRVLAAESLLGECLLAAGEREEASRLIKPAHDELLRMRGVDDEIVQDAARRMMLMDEAGD
ncbi:MAG: hypothetical protein ACYTHJ_18795, partial [Planctomycetota bacterium]